ncbi:sunset domain-containing protein [Pseudarthrobacter phenanthrenivorans]|uniref:sunset domain-containing protein n=1 Tax=Pseudarthrobacter phenanthrenivorans TaxID=361575 RepID=UPI002F352ACB
MDILFWIILIVVVAVIIWWLLKRNKAANPPGAPGAARTDTARPEPARPGGALGGGSAAASAEAVGTTAIPTAAGFGKPAEPPAPATADEPAESSAATDSGARATSDAGAAPQVASDAGTERAERAHQDQAVEADQAADQAEWETQWSEAGAVPRSGSSATSSAAAGAATPSEAPEAATPPPAGQQAVATEGTPAARPVHHDEYTAPHAATLPGAETAAVEGADDDLSAGVGQGAGEAAPPTADSHEAAVQQDTGAPVEARNDAGTAETLERAQSSALVENGADHLQRSGQEQGTGQGLGAAQGTAVTEPGGHLAADEPYGAGSAAPGPDGSGPADYTVKGDAAAMVYYEEGHPEYEQTRAEVWFESTAHAEAAGFRAPRRKRL